MVWRSSTPTADGRLDLFFTNGAAIDSGTSTTRPPDKREPRFWNRLYRNVGDWKFEDVTERSGLAGTRYDFGAAVADYDNDGDVDLHVTGLGGNTLYRNDGNGTFTDVTTASGAVSAGMVVERRVCRLRPRWPARHAMSAAISPGAGNRTSSAPQLMAAAVPTVIRALRSGAKRAAAQQRRRHLHAMPRPPAASPRILARRSASPSTTTTATAGSISSSPTTRCSSSCSATRGRGTFAEVALSAGVAFDDNGRSFAGMGTDVEDLRQRRLARRVRDRTQPRALRPVPRGGRRPLRVRVAHDRGRRRHPAALRDGGRSSWTSTTTAAAICSSRRATCSIRCRVRVRASTIFSRRSCCGTTAPSFVDVSASLGPAFARPAPGRGAAFGDLDDDGDLDFVVANLDAEPTLLRNEGGNASHWLTVALRGTRSNRQGIGAIVQVVDDRGRTQSRHLLDRVELPVGQRCARALRARRRDGDPPRRSALAERSTVRF